MSEDSGSGSEIVNANDETKPVTVLIYEFVTGGGLAAEDLPSSWAAEGSAMRRALARDFAAVSGLRVLMALDARLPEEPGPWTSIRVSREDMESFSRLAAQADEAIVVAPETGGILTDLARRSNQTGSLSLGASPEAIELCGDKLRLEHWLRDRGWPVATSRIVRPSLGLPLDASYPAILKPIDGAGCIDTFRIENPDRMPIEAKRRNYPMLLQKEESGQPMSACLLVSASGKAAGLAMGRQRIALDPSGRLSYQGGELPLGPVPETIARAAESIPGLHGFVGVDFLWQARDHHATILEINPRLTTSYAGLCRLLAPGMTANAWRSAIRLDDLGPARRLANILTRQRPIRFDTNANVDTAWDEDNP